MSRAYNQEDEVVSYPWWADVIGPKVTQGDTDALEMRAISEGWEDWFYHILRHRSPRKRRWLLAYLRDGVIKITVAVIDVDFAEDDDPWQGMG